jgi:hypothetical protein
MHSLDCGTQVHPTWFAYLRLDGLGSATGVDTDPMLLSPHINAGGVWMGAYARVWAWSSCLFWFYVPPVWCRAGRTKRDRASSVQGYNKLQCQALGAVRRSILLVRGWRVWHNKPYAMQRHRRNHTILGLGTQVKGHNACRFSVPWVPSRPRLRDIGLAIRAI